MPNPTLCEIVVLLDRSGSMASVKRDMEGGFSRFLDEQRKAPGDCRLTLVEFDTQGIDTVHENKPIAEVPALVLIPRGGTPLLDAMGETIERVGKRLESTDDAQRPGRVLFLVITDGQENSSHKFKQADIKRMVEHQTSVYQWAFTYLGANVDAFAEAGGIGINMAQAANFTPDSAGVAASFTAMSEASISYRSGGEYTYSDEQRKRMHRSTPA